MDSPFVTVHRDEIALRSPVLIAAFKGWNDAGDSASFAADHLRRVWGGEIAYTIDPEEFFDFQAVRPEVSLSDGVTRKIAWPSNDIFAARIEGAERDALIMVGTEPNLRWRTFTGLVTEIARSHQVSLVVTLGALLADVPHSRPVPITGTAADPTLVEKLGLHRSRYEGPTGIVGVLHDACARAGIPSASLWAAVPHYLAVTPNPRGALALVAKAMDLIGVEADIKPLERAAEIYDQRVGDVVAGDEDVQAYVHLLEDRIDDSEVDSTEMPSGDALAAELEKFLQERGDG
jgi:proteasome assembly chaperone (PAC2) family protein